MQCRDWLSTLWPASYRGFQFYFESDDEDGGRGIVIHKFPHRDSPYIEDLGEEPRFYEGAAYVHGDDADRLAAAFAAALAARGPATLVVPLAGPVLVHCQTFRRHHERDKLGYAAFQVKFVRAGAGSAIISIPFLSHLVHAAADRVADALAGTLPSQAAAADYAIDAAIERAESAAAAIDAARLAYAADPEVSARVRDRVSAIVDYAPALLAPAPPEDDVSAFLARAGLSADFSAGGGPPALAHAIVAATRDLGDALAPESAARAMVELAEINAASAPAYLAPAPAQASADALARVARLAALTAFSEAVIRRVYKSRPDGVSARAEVSERFEREMANTTGAENAALYLAIADLQGRVAEYLSRLINDLAPVIEIEAARQMPALYWAWRLYADPLRDREIVDRNRVRHPAFVPAKFAALSR
jgi:prophage DNA circulation protein